jgi:hypothetical protein
MLDTIYLYRPGNVGVISLRAGQRVVFSRKIKMVSVVVVFWSLLFGGRRSQESEANLPKIEIMSK